MTQDTLIQVKHLSRHYGPNIAVNNIQFELKRGEVVGFLGPNGAGKSTSMQMLTGNLAPTTGSIHICGIDLLDKPKQAKANIGYLPEQPPVYKELTVDEYLKFCARIHAVEKNRVAAAVDSCKQRCGLSTVGQRLIGNLSKGYQQRVGIAQAIIHSPAIIVLDEPTVGLDPIQIREIRTLIRELGQEHGVILSTHILPEVQMTCDRVQIIRSGELVYQDTLEALEHQFTGSCLIIGLGEEISADKIKTLADINSIEQISAKRWRLIFDDDNNPVEDIAKQIVENGWGLTELTPEQKTLEQIFVDITTSEDDETTLNPASTTSDVSTEATS
ncbi:Gliding motility-associated ABC transporter ATP-binding protein GldA [hydrothermal vent metagenome]|uniref:Gliding motility-associated ABC transporter ATP-binding protein GldA n=1 Tax=hydrothermal vent metagenome TaxID=652676 RepID=A0A3B0ZGA6_9ZZZZ